MNKKIGIIDVGIGNIKSIQNMLYSCEADSYIITNPNEINNFSKVILPGVGSFDAFMKKLNEYNFVKPLKYNILKKKISLLGICLGMHVLFKKSEEGQLEGLFLLDGIIEKISNYNNKTKIPHNGWNTLKLEKESKLLSYTDDLRFYFNHSYFLKSTQKKNILTTTNYNENFISSVEFENIYGVQFHPEKSHKYGKTFFLKFIKL
tara:strand:- start:5850 stop:6464 length:615 start_codon:yes stop_codon:yes gene_type:complete